MLEAVRGADGLKLSYQARAGRSPCCWDGCLSGGAWQRLEDADPGRETIEWEVRTFGGAPTADRFYRLVTPKLP